MFVSIFPNNLPTVLLKFLIKEEVWVLRGFRTGELIVQCIPFFFKRGNLVCVSGGWQSEVDDFLVQYCCFTDASFALLDRYIPVCTNFWGWWRCCYVCCCWFSSVDILTDISCVRSYVGVHCVTPRLSLCTHICLCLVSCGTVCG